MGLKSKVSKAKIGTSSLRTTISEGIVEYLNLKSGDKLDWSMEIVGNATRATFVKRFEK
ncbi:MAG: AbrB family transcriptional regulator [Candidatus Bathyarchaeia archaeon]|nr:AbrB family transcriptional regulator [Candidatus Bathyarchaeota archaeon]